MDKFKFGEFIYNMRIANHLTQEELGRKLGVTNKAVSKWETGETLPDINLMPSLAKALGVTIDELYTGEIIKKEPVTIIEKKKPIYLIIIIVILSLLLVGTSTYILVKSINEKYNDNVITLNEENYQKYLVITPVYRSANIDKNLSVYGKIELLNRECFIDQINIEFTYSIEYYYVDNDNKNALISYINKKEELTIDSSCETMYVLNVEPITELTNFKEYKEFVFNYRIDKIEGSIKNI